MLVNGFSMFSLQFSITQFSNLMMSQYLFKQMCWERTVCKLLLIFLMCLSVNNCIKSMPLIMFLKKDATS